MGAPVTIAERVTLSTSASSLTVWLVRRLRSKHTVGFLAYLALRSRRRIRILRKKLFLRTFALLRASR
jgi:hypothetical protein